MGWISNLLAGGVVETAKGVADVVDRFVETDDEKAAVKTVMARMAQEPGLAQIELNKVGAAHRSIWVAGWRPAIGWVLAVSLALFYIPQFAVASFMWAYLFIDSCMSATGCAVAPYPIESIRGLTELVYGMLGLAGLRTVEKLSGRAK